MAKTIRLRRLIAKYLNAKGEASFTSIMTHINETTRHGTTSQQLGNVLAKNTEFRNCGKVFQESILSGGYDVTVWEMNEN